MIMPKKQCAPAITASSQEVQPTTQARNCCNLCTLQFSRQASLSDAAQSMILQIRVAQGKSLMVRKPAPTASHDYWAIGKGLLSRIQFHTSLCHLLSVIGRSNGMNPEAGVGGRRRGVTGRKRLEYDICIGLVQQRSCPYYRRSEATKGPA